MMFITSLFVQMFVLLQYVLSDYYTLRYDRAICVSSGDVKIITCEVKPINRTIKSLDLEFRFQNTTELKFEYEMFYKYGVIFRTFDVKSVDDACGYLNGTSKSPLLNNFIPLMRHNYPELYSHPCPIDYFTVRQFWGDVSHMNLPPIIPAGQYRIVMSLYNRRFNVTTTILISIKPIGANQLLMG